jgi:hypothetical protein
MVREETSRRGTFGLNETPRPECLTAATSEGHPPPSEGHCFTLASQPKSLPNTTAILRKNHVRRRLYEQLVRRLRETESLYPTDLGRLAFVSREMRDLLGAEEGTRTPTPLRVHGPEPCASANSATSARVTADFLERKWTRNRFSVQRGAGPQQWLVSQRRWGKSNIAGSGVANVMLPQPVDCTTTHEEEGSAE